YQAELHSRKLATTHFWLGTIGILLYIIPIYAAGLTQGLMWRAFDASGTLLYGDLIETVIRLKPLYWIRVLGGSMYVAGLLLCGWNLLRTWQHRPAKYDVPVVQAPALSRHWTPPPTPPSPLSPLGTAELGRKLDVLFRAEWHRRWEGLPLRFS